MIEAIGEILIIILDLFLITSSSKKRKYDKIAQIIEIWADRTGISKENILKNDKYRTISFTDDNGNKYFIGIKSLRWGRLRIIAKNDIASKKKKVWNKNCNSSNLMRVLFESYGVVEQWILKSGNTRTID